MVFELETMIILNYNRVTQSCVFTSGRTAACRTLHTQSKQRLIDNRLVHINVRYKDIYLIIRSVRFSCFIQLPGVGIIAFRVKGNLFCGGCFPGWE